MRAEVLGTLAGSIGPDHGDSVDLLGRTESELQLRLAAAEGPPAAGAELTLLNEAGGFHFDSGTDGEVIGMCRLPQLDGDSLCCGAAPKQ